MERAWQLAPGVAVRTAVGSVEADALAEVFPAFEVAEVVAGARLATEALGDGALRVSLDGLALFTAADDELAPALEAALLGWVVRTRGGVVPLHASAVAVGARAVLFLGDKGSGKSTLAAQLGAAWPYLGDEVAFVRITDNVLEPFPKAATIKAGAFAVMPASRDWRDPVRGPVRYHAPALSSRAELPIGALVWPQWSAPSPAALSPELAPLAPDEMAVRLIRQSFGGLERDPRTLDTIAALAALPGFELRYTSTAQARVALEQALAP
jgi:hypothetical protein